MRKSLILLLLLATHAFSQEQYVTLGNAPAGGFIFDGGLNFERSKNYVSRPNSLPINQNYLGVRLKAEYGILWNLKVTSEFNTKNLSVQNGLVGLKYEKPLASNKVLKNGNSMAIVLVPQLNFIFPLWKYDTESVLAIGNRNLGGSLGSTFWIPIYRINADIKVYAGYNLYLNPVPNCFQLFSKFGKIFGPVYVGLHYNWQKSFGAADYFSGSFSTFRELPVTYNEFGFEVNYLHDYKWEVGLQGDFLFRGNNVRKSLGAELSFTYYLTFDRR